MLALQKELPMVPSPVPNFSTHQQFSPASHSSTKGSYTLALWVTLALRMHTLLLFGCSEDIKIQSASKSDRMGMAKAQTKSNVEGIECGHLWLGLDRQGQQTNRELRSK